MIRKSRHFQAISCSFLSSDLRLRWITPALLLFDSIRHALFIWYPFDTASFKWLISSKEIDGRRVSQLGFERKISFCFALMLVFSKYASPLSCHPGLNILLLLETAWTLNSRFYKVMCLSSTEIRRNISPKYLVIFSYIVSMNSIWQFLYSVRAYAW